MLYISFTASVNDQSVARLLNEVTAHVNKGEKDLTLLMSTPGGYVSGGINAFNTFKILPIKKVFWNIGNIDSIGVMMFLAGDERYALPNSRFLFHDVSWQSQGPVSLSEKDLRLNADSIKHDRDAISTLSANVTGQTADNISQMMSSGKIISASEAKTLGYIQEEKNLILPEGVQIININ